MALDRCIRNQTEPQVSVYDERDLFGLQIRHMKEEWRWRSCGSVSADAGSDESGPQFR